MSLHRSMISSLHEGGSVTRMYRRTKPAAPNAAVCHSSSHRPVELRPGRSQVPPAANLRQSAPHPAHPSRRTALIVLPGVTGEDPRRHVRWSRRERHSVASIEEGAVVDEDEAKKQRLHAPLAGGDGVCDDDASHRQNHKHRTGTRCFCRFGRQATSLRKSSTVDAAGWPRVARRSSSSARAMSIPPSPKRRSMESSPATLWRAMRMSLSSPP